MAIVFNVRTGYIECFDCESLKSGYMGVGLDEAHIVEQRIYDRIETYKVYTCEEIYSKGESRSSMDTTLKNVENEVINNKKYADVLVEKISDSDVIVAGREMAYYIKVSNQGPDNAQNVALTDSVSYILNPQYSQDRGRTWKPWIGFLNIGDMEGLTSLNMIIRGVVDPSCKTSIVNTAIVISTTEDPSPGNNTSTVFTGIETLANISIDNIVSDNEVIAGDVLTYNIEVENNGPSDAENVVVNDSIDEHILNAEYSLDDGITWMMWDGAVNIGKVKSESKVRLLIRGNIDQYYQGSISNIAIVSTTTSAVMNNSSIAVTEVKLVSDIAIVGEVSSNAAIGGDRLIYTMEISNKGPADAENVKLEGKVVSFLANQEYSLDEGGTWNRWSGVVNLGIIKAQESLKVRLQGTVKTPYEGVEELKLTVSSTTLDKDLSDNSMIVLVNIKKLSDIAIRIVSTSDNLISGQGIMYTIVVENRGPSDGDNVTLTDELSPYILNPEYSLDDGLKWESWSGCLDLGTIVNGGCQTILIRGTVDSICEDSISYIVSVSSKTLDKYPKNNIVTLKNDVKKEADISIDNTLISEQIIAGDMIEYSIKIENKGSSYGENVILTDELPACIINQEYSINQELQGHPWKGCVNLGAIAPGNWITVSIRGRIDSAYKGRINAIATVKSTTYDPDITNNISKVSGEVKLISDIVFTNISNKDNVTAGDDIQYKLVVSNKGPSNTNNIIVEDEMPHEILKPRYSLDGGVTWNQWEKFYYIESLVVGESVDILIKGIISENANGVFTNTAKVTSKMFNLRAIADVNVKTCKLKIDIRADKKKGKIGEDISYKIQIKNVGNIVAENAVLKNLIPLGTRLVNGSMDNNKGLDLEGNLSGGINIGAILPNTSFVVNIIVKVGEYLATREIKNSPIVEYEFLVDPNRDLIKKYETSNEEITQMEDIKLEVEGKSDKLFVMTGEIITYELEITNRSTIKLYDLKVNNYIPKGTELVLSSIKVNDNNILECSDEYIGVGELDFGKKAKISFKVKVLSQGYSWKIENKGFIAFKYSLEKEILCDSLECNFNVIDKGVMCFKELIINEYLTIPRHKPKVEDILNVVSDSVITSKYLVKTAKGVSLGGEVLTGCKLFIKGIVKERIEYSTSDLNQNICVEQFDINFTTDIVLPEGFIEEANMNVQAHIEDVYTRCVNETNIVNSIVLRVEAVG